MRVSSDCATSKNAIYIVDVETLATHLKIQLFAELPCARIGTHAPVVKNTFVFITWPLREERCAAILIVRHGKVTAHLCDAGVPSERWVECPTCAQMCPRHVVRILQLNVECV